MLAILVAVVFLIIYGSLYPWHFAYRELPGNPLWVMLHSGGMESGRRFIADIVVNVALYVPLGMAGYLALRRHRVMGPVLLGIVLSASIETLQLFTPGRVSSVIDFTNNTLGAILGVALGALFEKLAGPEVIEFGHITAGHRGALALLFCWVSLMLFPFYPETHLAVLTANLSRFTASPLFVTATFLSAAMMWLVVGRLLAAAGFAKVKAWLAFLLLLLPAQFLIVTRQPDPSEWLGAAAGVLMFLLLGAKAKHAGPIAWSFVALLLVRGLVPFHLAARHSFEWIPFGGFLNMNWQSGLRVLLEKIFFYGSAVWLLRASGMRILAATAVVSGVLLLIEIVQTHLPGRVAEITEPFLCVLIGFGLWALNPRRQSDAVLLPPVRR